MAPFSHFRVFSLSFAKMIFAKNFVQKRKNEKNPVFCLKIAKNGLKFEAKDQKCQKKSFLPFFSVKNY